MNFGVYRHELGVLSAKCFCVADLMIVSGGYSYQIKGCAGQGGFAQVFKACCDGNPDEVVALKVK